jgi:hypothetical protein
LQKLKLDKNASSITAQQYYSSSSSNEDSQKNNYAPTGMFKHEE